MKKLKKSLAIILAIMMIASFTPLFASAADITLSNDNIILLEAPTLTYGEISGTNIEIEYNPDLRSRDIAVTGGKLAYVASEGAEPVVVEGTFAHSLGTRKLNQCKEYAMAMKFTPADTTKYSTVTVNTKTPLAEGVKSNTVLIVGAYAEIVEAPVPTKNVILGTNWSANKLTGGKVVDRNGAELTGGEWNYNLLTQANEAGTFEVEVKWALTGYNTVYTTVTATVAQPKGTVQTMPSFSAVAPGSLSTDSSLTYGVVVDQETGNEVSGVWSVVSRPAYVYADTPVVVQWKQQNYEPILVTVTIPVTQPMEHDTYVVEKAPYLAQSAQYLTWSPTLTWDNIEIVEGLIKDKNGNVVPGTYKTNQSGNIELRNKAFYLSIIFTPDDASLPTLEFRDMIKGVEQAPFELGEDFEIVIGEGEIVLSDTADTVYVRNYDSDPNQKAIIAKSTLTTIPADAGIGTVSWLRSDFDPTTAQPGDEAVVTAQYVKPANENYASKVTTDKCKIKVRVQKRVIDTTFAGEIQIGSRRQYNASVYQQDPLQKIDYTIDFTQPMLKGNVNVNLVAPDGTKTLVTTITPDENGRFYVKDSTYPTVSGRHKVEFEYIPSENDTAEVTGALVLTVELNIKLLFERTVYVTVGDVTKEFKYMDAITGTRRAYIANEEFDEAFPNFDEANFISWTFKDADGNEFTPKRTTNSIDPTAIPYIDFGMPEHDVYITANMKTTIGGGIDTGDSSFLDSFMSFWQKIVDFVVKIYQMFYDMFKF